MDKKIVKAMFANIVCKDQARPQLMGVHFEQDRCCATDTRMLVVYHAGSDKLAGKTIAATGEEVAGRYPDFDRVIPAKASQTKLPFRLDLEQLQKACSWFMRLPGSNEKDVVLINEKPLSVKFLAQLLMLFVISGEIKKAEFVETGESRPAMITSNKLTAILMPMSQSDTAKVDAPREDDCSVALSLENLINMFVFEGWKKVPTADPMGWLD